MTTTPDLLEALAHTVAIDDDAGVELADRLPPGPVLSWVRDGAGLVGWGEVARASFTGPGSLHRADQWWQALSSRLRIVDDVGVSGSGPIAFVSGAFDNRLADTVVVVPATVVGRSRGSSWLTSYESGAERASDGDSQLPPIERPRGPGMISYSDGSCTATQWRAAVAETVRRIRAGEAGKVVLARDVIATADETIDARFLLRQLMRRYPSCWTFLVDGLIGATPELLVSRQGERIAARALAGTLRPGQGAELFSSPKERAEHEYAARSVAEVLARHCSSLQLPDAPELLELPNVVHLSTPIHGLAATPASALALAADLHPTAAVCGTPREVAADLIPRLEQMDRGRYAGPVGWVDTAGNGEFGIALRCGQLDGNQLRMFAGCGIVEGSDPDAELAESVAKMVTMRDALEADAGDRSWPDR
ncbi:MAG: isochorismate synthase [Mycobacteriales bacterium]